MQSIEALVATACSGLTFPEGVTEREEIQEQETPASQHDNIVTGSISQRILDGFAVARVYATQLVDPEYRRNTENKLSRSNVRGSLVVGITRADDVTAMLASVTDWREVTANLKDKEIKVFEGTLPSTYVAFAAYASVREIGRMYGHAGLGSIQAKIGYQKPDEYYLCTMLRVETRTITVQLKKDDSNVEHLHQWFAGYEVSSRMRVDDGDTNVRCGVQIQPLDQQRPLQGQGQKRRQNRP